ncbi:MAG: anti-sigma factor family protein [Bacteroidota bacterium]
MKTPSFHDVEQLSALLDGKLSRAESERIEQRLKSDRALQAVMEDLAQTRRLLRKLPARRAPRNFTLTPKMAGVRPPVPRAVPTLRFATVLATLLLVFSMAANTLVPAMRQTAAAPVYGMGGGGGGAEGPGPEQAGPAPTEVPALAQTIPPAPAGTLEATLSTQDSSRFGGTPTPEPFLKSVPAEQNPVPAGPIPLGWEIGLLVLALASAGGAWLIRSSSDRSWREKMK